MRFLISVVSVVIGLSCFLPSVQAAEVPLASKYDFANDPFLTIWTFAAEEKKPIVTNTGEMTADDKKLARWKEKQAHLWANLEIGKRFTINASAYTAAADECGKSDGVTASGLVVEENRTLACPKELPFGAKIKIDGMGTFRCEDRGGAIKGNHIDIYMETKSEAFAFGRQNLGAEIVN